MLSWKKWNVFDTQKLGILVALELAAEVGRLNAAQDNDARWWSASPRN